MKRKLKWIILITSIIILLPVGYFSYTIIKFGMDIGDNNKDSLFSKFQNQESNIKTEYTPPEWEGKENVNILLLGGDTRGLGKDEIPRSDSIMILSLNPVEKQAYLFSVLRDTYVDIPDHGKNKINAALAIGGPNLAMKTASNLLDIPIQYYVYVDFQGFIKLIDAIGGIDYYVEKNMRYTDISDEEQYNINLKEGMQHLDGNQALQYVRFRHDRMSDFTRTERQRNFLKAVAEKLQSTSSLVTLPKILNKVEPYIETNIALDNMIRLGSLGFKIKSESIGTEQLPPFELLKEESVDGLSVITTDVDRLQQYVKEKLETKPISSEKGRVDEKSGN